MPVLIRRGAAEDVVGLRHAVLRPGRPESDARWAGDTDPETQHWIATLDSEVVGVATVMRAPFPDGVGPEWQVRGMAVSPSFQGQGVGRQLLEALSAAIGAPLWCNARVAAMPLYLRAGWRSVSATFEISGVGPHQRMRS